MSSTIRAADAEAVRNDTTGKMAQLLKKRQALDKRAEETRAAIEQAKETISGVQQLGQPSSKRPKFTTGGIIQGASVVNVESEVDGNNDVTVSGVAGGAAVGGPSASVIANKFDNVSQAEKLEEQFRNETIGLQSLDAFTAKRKQIDDLLEKDALERMALKQQQMMGIQNLNNQSGVLNDSSNQSSLMDNQQQKKKVTVKKANLSFAGDDDSDEDKDSDHDSEEVIVKPKKNQNQKPQQTLVSKAANPSTALNNSTSANSKNPFVDTSFLEDKEREKQKELRKKELIEEYHRKQEETKQQLMPVVFSYWDGSGHRRSLKIQKQASIGQFLKAARSELVRDFHDLRHCTHEDLLFIKEDLILPHTVTFYELIRDEARGKNGNALFNFEVQSNNLLEGGDVRKIQQGTSEITHAAKIVQRSWYDKHKHVFPQKNWKKYEVGKIYHKSFEK